MSRALDFFTPTQRDQIKECIRKAEEMTSGEIRVHLENHVLVDVLDRAAYVFEQLEMHKTSNRNAVLIYLAVKDGKLAILGDAAVHDALGLDYWNSTKDMMLHYFNEGDFVCGVEKAVEDVGNKLKEFFPINPTDENELKNEISDDFSLNDN